MLNRQVLVVDDDEDIRTVVGMVLEAQGFEVISARDGLDALNVLQRGLRPAVILLDMMMPRLDGEGFLEEFHADPELKDIPVILMSGYHQANQKGEELAASGVLVKPVELDDLLAAVNRFVPMSPHAPMEGAPL